MDTSKDSMTNTDTPTNINTMTKNATVNDTVTETVDKGGGRSLPMWWQWLRQCHRDGCPNVKCLSVTQKALL